jgi:hypothetical protein
VAAAAPALWLALSLLPYAWLAVPGALLALLDLSLRPDEEAGP